MATHDDDLLGAEFSRAAETLSLTQPSVSHQVALLKTEIGVRLLNRGPGGLRLTHAGAVLLEHADQVAWRLQLADTQIADLAGEQRDQVRLAAFPTALAGFVPAALALLRIAHGDLRVRLSEVTPSTLEQRLLSGELDIAVTYQDATAQRANSPAPSASISSKTPSRCASRHSIRSPTRPAPSRWSSLPKTTGSSPPQTDASYRPAATRASTPHIVATTSDPLATRGLVARGLGIGWVSSLLIEDYTGVATRPVTDAMPARDIYALLPPGDRHPHADNVTDALTETAAGLNAAA